MGRCWASGLGCVSAFYPLSFFLPFGAFGSSTHPSIHPFIDSLVDGLDWGNLGTVG